MVVTANHYTLTSLPFAVVPSTALVLSASSQGTVHVGYPVAVENTDVTARPSSVDGGRFAGRRFSGAVITASTVDAGAVEDAFGNCNGSAFGEAGSVSTCPATRSGTTTTASVAGASVAGAPALPNTSPAPPSGLAGIAAILVGAVLRRRRRRAV